MTKRRQLVEMRKSARQQAKADLRNGAAESVEDLTGELLELLERRISEVEERIAGLLANDAVLAETAAILQSVPGIGPVACAMPVAEMPELGRISGEQAAALAASIRNTDLKLFADRLRKEGKPHKVVAANRMTDRGPSAAAGWGRGNVDNPFRRFRSCLGPGLDCPHFHGPTQKKSFIEKPRRAVAEWKAPNRDRPPTAESVESVVNPGPERETRTQREQGLSTGFPCSPRRRERKTAERPDKDRNPGRRPGSSSEADESDPAQPRRCKTRTNPQRPAPARFHPDFDNRETQLLVSHC